MSQKPTSIRPPAPAYGALSEPPRLRHVVFVDRALVSAARRRRALDLGPVVESPPPARASTESSCARDQEAFIRWLFNKAGLDGRLYGAQTLTRRMSACLRTLRATSFTHARRI